MTKNLESFKKRIANAHHQVSDLVNGGYFNNNEEQPFGLTVGDLWETAKFQFSEAKKLYDKLLGEEKNLASSELEKFRKEFSEHMPRLE